MPEQVKRPKPWWKKKKRKKMMIKILVLKRFTCCFILYDYITIHGAKNIKNSLKFCLTVLATAKKTQRL
jgi:hypothetical protein